MRAAVYVTLITTTLQLVEAIFTENSEARQSIDGGQLGFRFYTATNRSSSLHLKLLKIDGNSILIGSQNAVQNISAVDFSVRKPLLWPPSTQDVQNCQMNGKSEEYCQNYIRILAKDSDGTLVVCGTNAYRPACRTYTYSQDGHYIGSELFDGAGLSPYDPNHNSTAIYIPESKELYAGTVSDFAGSEPLIHRQKLNTKDLGIRTERSDTKVLNEPNFVRSFVDPKHVYMMFRETTTEYTNCGKAVVARVGRVCKNDKGGSRGDTWTTFLKARLNCSIPSGDIPFYFDQLESTTDPISGDYGIGGNSNLVYGVFTTPYDTVKMSAVCAFSMSEIQKIFSNSGFKPSSGSYCTPAIKTDEPRSRPGDCEVTSPELSPEVLNFMKKNSLMEQIVPNFFSDPLLLQAGKRTQFTQIAVDPQVLAIDGKTKYDILYLGTTDGMILKAARIADVTSNFVVLIANITLFTGGRPVRNVVIHQQSKSDTTPADKRLIVVGDDEIRSIPLQFCSRAKDCSSCVQLQDPHCAWDKKQNICLANDHSQWPKGDFIQNIKTGTSEKCGKPDLGEIRDAPDMSAKFTSTTKLSNSNSSQLLNRDLNDPGVEKAKEGCNCEMSDKFKKEFDKNNGINDNILVADSSKIQSAGMSVEVIVIAVVATFVIATLIGVVGGYKLSQTKLLEKKFASWSNPYTVGGGKKSSASYNNNSEKLVAGRKLSNHIDAYQSTPKFNGSASEPPVNLVLTLEDSKLDRTSMNNLSSSFSTLPKDYKVKKMYL